MKKHLVVTTRTREGVSQRRMVALDRYCSISEVDTEMGPRTLIKFLPDPTQEYNGPDRERPIFAIESMDQIIVALGDEIAVCTASPKSKSRRRRG